MNDKYAWALAALILGVLIARNGKAATSTQVHNETDQAGQWWSYAGQWAS